LAVQVDVLDTFGAVTWRGVQNGEVYRLVTAGFLHANLLHILLNSISLLFIGTRFEKIYPKQTPFILLISCISGTLKFYIFRLHAQCALRG